MCLMKLSIKQETQKFKTKKGQKEYEQNFANFASGLLYDKVFDDKNNKI